MPCRSEGDYEDGNSAYNRLLVEHNKVTRYACEAFALLEKKKCLASMTGSAKLWWINHKKVDQEREEQQKRQQLADRVSKLTKEIEAAVRCGRTESLKTLRKDLDALLSSQEET